jgi:hypothetical protein
MTQAGAPEGAKVRDDPTGIVGSVIQQHIETARGLIASGEGILDERGSGCWRQELMRWRRECASALHREFEPETAAEYLRASVGPHRTGCRWESRLHHELRGVDDAIELLAALQMSLSARGGPGGRRR